MYRFHIHYDDPIATIEPEVYGHFAEHIGGVIYDGIWVGEDSPIPHIHGFRKELIDKLRAIHAPIIRWPGGCFAEAYNWRDGIGPQATRPTRPGWWTGLDGRYEPNTVGTHEFIDFCHLVGAKPYIAANITSLSPQDIRDWVDYCNSPAGTTTLAQLREKNGSREPFDITWWGVGNETWGDGGNMTPEMYAHEYRKYAVILDNTAPGLKLIASGANAGDWRWPAQMLPILESSRRKMAGMSLHYYCGGAGTCTSFTEDEWYHLLRRALDMEAIIRRNWGFVVGYGMEKQARLVIDEWGCWHPGTSGPSFHRKEDGIAPAPNNPQDVGNLFEQQSTMRDAVITAATLNIFHNHAEKVKMAAVAQLTNNLHALFLCGGDHLICTPTYHVFDMMQGHMGGTALRISGDTGQINRGNDSLPALSLSASVKESTLTVTIANLNMTLDAAVTLISSGMQCAGTAEFAVLHAPDAHAHNTFAQPDTVTLRRKTIPFDGSILVPAHAVVTVTVSFRG